MHFKIDIFNSDRLLLTFGGFVRLFAQIHHSMDGNDNGFVDLFHRTSTHQVSCDTVATVVAVATVTTQTAAAHDSFMGLGVNLAKTPLGNHNFSTAPD